MTNGNGKLAGGISMTDGILAGKIALITGASSGIGQAAAFVFARHGAKVVLGDVQREAGEQTAQRVRDEGGEALFVEVDVSQAKQVEALVRRAVAEFGRLDCAFNNAGIDGDMCPTAMCSEENWDRVIGVNLRGVWLCMKYEITQMLTQGGGAIVNTSSVAGLTSFPGLPACSA